jgi:hypothetical protein
VSINWERWLRGYEVEYQEKDDYEDIDWVERLAAEIRRAWKTWGFTGFFIYGKQGSGKTTLSLQIARRAYGSWWKALNHLYFDPADIEQVVHSSLEIVEKTKRSDARLPVIIWDDAGVWASKYIIRMKGGARYAMAVQNLVELARRIAAGIIVTATDPNRTLTPFRTQEWYYIKISGPFREAGKQYSRATIYRLSITPLGRAYVVRRGSNLSFPLKMPDKVRQRHTELNLMYVKRAPLQFSWIIKEEKIKETFEEGIDRREKGEDFLDYY